MILAIWPLKLPFSCDTAVVLTRQSAALGAGAAAGLSSPHPGLAPVLCRQLRSGGECLENAVLRVFSGASHEEQVSWHYILWSGQNWQVS